MQNLDTPETLLSCILKAVDNYEYSKHSIRKHIYSSICDEYCCTFNNTERFKSYLEYVYPGQNVFQEILKAKDINEEKFNEMFKDNIYMDNMYYTRFTIEDSVKLFWGIDTDCPLYGIAVNQVA